MLLFSPKSVLKSLEFGKKSADLANQQKGKIFFAAQVLLSFNFAVATSLPSRCPSGALRRADSARSRAQQ